MFEMIHAQDKVLNLLRHDIENQTMHNSMIFYGQKACGKLTTALELARVLNCQEDRSAGCNCRHCINIRDLNFEGLIFISRRDFSLQLKQLVKSYLATGESYYMAEMIRILKLVCLPLQDFLIKGTFGEAEKKQIGEVIKQISDIIFEEKIGSKKLNSLVGLVEKLQLHYKKQNIPVNTIRAMLDWTYISQPDINRVVIIDHFDKFESSSQNIMLKRLEEPSKNLFFVLISETKTKILQTILSRCRSYFFSNPSQQETNDIILKSFDETGEYKSVYHFLIRDEDFSRDKIMAVLVELLNIVFMKEATFADLSSFLGAYNNRSYVKSLLFYLKESLDHEILRRQTGLMGEPEISLFKRVSNHNINYLNDLITKKYNTIDVFNLNALWILEGIFYPLKVMVHNDKI